MVRLLLCPTSGRLDPERSWHWRCSNDRTMENELEPIRFLTVREAAEMLQVSKRTLERMIYDKKFPAFKVGHQWRVSESQLNKWVKTLDEL